MRGCCAPLRRPSCDSRGATTLNDIGYTLDANGNRTAISAVLGGATLTTNYQYDPLQRLKEARYPAIPSGPAAQTVAYTLDAAGNRLDDGTTTRSYDAADRIVGAQYDAVGNLLDDGTTTYAYDAANRLIQTSSAGVVTTYGYDGWGTLMRETRAGVTTDFVLDEQAGLPRVLAAIRADGSEELYAYGPDGLLAQRTISGATDQTSYALLDAQASLLHLTDSAGSLTLTRVYDAWGSLRFTSGSATSRLGYTGELMGQDGTVYLRARHYLPQLGRFLQRDSFPGIPDRPQSLHRSTYAEHNPARFTDQTGHTVDQYGRWTPCNLLPGRADTCTAGDFVDWWGTDEPAKVGRFTVTVVNDFASIPAVMLGLPYQLLTDPQGVAWAVLYSPFQLGEDVLVGTLCGDPERLGHATSAYAMFVFGGVKASLEKPGPGVRPPHGEAPRPHLDEPPRAPGERPRLPIDGLCSFSGDTVVATADGDQPIATLAVGDLVYGFDERSGTTGLFTVTAVLVHADPVLVHLTLDDETLETTPEHPFFVAERGWVAAGDLQAGDALRQRAGRSGTKLCRLSSMAAAPHRVPQLTPHTTNIA